MSKPPIGTVTGKPLIKCATCKKRWGQELPLPFGPQNICYHCGAKKCRDMLTSPNPLFKMLNKIK